jgi:hypothetical protein
MQLQVLLCHECPGNFTKYIRRGEKYCQKIYNCPPGKISLIIYYFYTPLSDDNTNSTNLFDIFDHYRSDCVVIWIMHFGLKTCFCLFVTLFVYSRLSSYPAAVTITGNRAANLHLCLALMVFSSEGSFSCHTYCDTGPRFIRSHPKDRHPCPTVGFEPGTQGSSDLCVSALTTTPRGWLFSFVCCCF